MYICIYTYIKIRRTYVNVNLVIAACLDDVFFSLAYLHCLIFLHETCITFIIQKSKKEMNYTHIPKRCVCQSARFAASNSDHLSSGTFFVV